MPPTLEPDTAAIKTLAERAHRQIRADIIAGRFQPDDKLRIEELRDTYSIGASPLREALSRLAAEGLVVAIGQRGFRVAPVSLEELRDITRVRILLEIEALKDSVVHGDDAWEAAVVAAFHRLSKIDTSQPGMTAQYESRNHDFHESLVAACRSPLLRRYRAAVYDQHKRYRILSLQDEPRQGRDLQHEHRAILDAILARDVATACAAAELHILTTVQHVERIFTRMGGAPATAQRRPAPRAD
ncbi:MAG: FCD domain-containing protein [Gammaproteobacteria bacterium]|nr:FCD domain-containing protein [Gammaproteobacteria bacterium]